MQMHVHMSVCTARILYIVCVSLYVCPANLNNKGTVHKQKISYLIC